ncbi:hypothetical protein J21TS7_39580 [Paenibacillus cineris]|uniref:Uncharacterized protein n=1 Tax=Paenibacillus cineris TaxID=237530 RepID=A0ABQ4LH18_9BACL|nr:hypothetical protein J21TS7_39580 [Paenibacillus cineris]
MAGGQPLGAAGLLQRYVICHARQNDDAFDDPRIIYPNPERQNVKNPFSPDAKRDF